VVAPVICSLLGRYAPAEALTYVSRTLIACKALHSDPDLLELQVGVPTITHVGADMQVLCVSRVRTRCVRVTSTAMFERLRCHRAKTLGLKDAR